MATRKRIRKARRKGARRFLSIMFRTLLIGSLVLFLGAGGYLMHVARSGGEIDPTSIYSKIEKTTYLYDANGNEIDKLYYTEDRTLLKSEDIPSHVKNAFIAIEDKTFYEHHGFNFKRIIGAVINKILGRSDEISGTSTITQQLARNVFLADIKGERTISRKAREMYYAWQIEKALSKDDILEAYLNTIYLGYGCYGLDAAAHTYFSKEPSELSLAEAAALAALPQAPDTYALLQNEEGEDTTYLKKVGLYANDASKERRGLVLDLMQEQGYISSDEAKKADVDIKDILKPKFSKGSGAFTYFSDYVSAMVANDLSEQYGMTEKAAERMVHTGGLHIFSTVDPEMQAVINAEFSNDGNFPWSSEEPQAAMVITEVGTGRIRAMVGGRNTKGKQLFNRATSPRQPGSSIKPLAVYSAALQKSYECAKDGQAFPFTDYEIDKQGISEWGNYITASSRVTDERTIVGGNVWPLNFSRTYSGRRTFRAALQQSINTCAVKIQLQVGAEYSMKMLKKYGITTAVDDASASVNDLNPAAMALGAMTYGTTPLEMSLAYGAFPGGGKRCEPRCYDRVTDSEGNLLLDGETKKVKVLDEGVAYIMTDILQSVVSRGIAYSASIYGVQVGGKTGTTNDTFDIWFCGFTPKYSAALWIGTDHNVVMDTTSNTAAALWATIMGQIPGVTEGEYPEQPSDVVVKWGEYYTAGTEPAYYTADQPGSTKKKTSSSSSSSSDDDDDSSSSRRRSSGSSSNRPHSDDADTDAWIEDWFEEND